MRWLRSITCMNIGMFLHVRFLMETFATVIARVWPRITMYQQVGAECWRPFECFTALLTFELLLQTGNFRALIMLFNQMLLEQFKKFFYSKAAMSNLKILPPRIIINDNLRFWWKVRWQKYCLLIDFKHCRNF